MFEVTLDDGSLLLLAFRLSDKNGLFQKKNRVEGLRTCFFENPPALEFFMFFFYFNPGNSRQSKTPPLEIPQNCVRSLGNSKTKTKTPGISALIFLLHPWKFSFVFNYPLEILYGISLIPLEIPYPLPVCFFSGVAQYDRWSTKWHMINKMLCSKKIISS